MIRIHDACPAMGQAYRDGRFDLERWKAYIRREVLGAEELCLEDLRACLDAGYSWEGEYLPVLNTAWRETRRREAAESSFRAVTQGLEENILRRFGRCPEVDVILYLGLGNGAGWVTPVRGRPTVLLGIEKILELGWEDERSFTGLIWHELGHVYQGQFGVLTRKLTGADAFLWQLFTEGIAMVFEQELAGNPGYFHQDREGWAAWCAAHLGEMARDFAADLPTMTPDSQRWFGDWVSYRGQPDAGYYLGAKFVRSLLGSHSFDSLLDWDVPQVRAAYESFLNGLAER